MAWALFFGRYGTPESIAAVTLFLPLARALCRAGIGLVALRPALDDISSLLGQEAEPEQVMPETEAE